MGQNNADYCGDQESRDGKECSGLWTNSGVRVRWAGDPGPLRVLMASVRTWLHRLACPLPGPKNIPLCQSISVRTLWERVKGRCWPVTCPHGTWCATTTGAASRWPPFNFLVGFLKFLIVSFVAYMQLTLIWNPAYLFYSRASVDAHNSKLKYSAYYLLPSVSSPQLSTLPLTTQCYYLNTYQPSSVHYSYSTLISQLLKNVADTR